MIKENQNGLQQLHVEHSHMTLFGHEQSFFFITVQLVAVFRLFRFFYLCRALSDITYFF